MARLDKDRQKELEPKRIEFAKNVILSLGYEITSQTSTSIEFIFKNEKVTLFPYSGWHTGKSIKDGRGIEKLIKQINEQKEK